AHDDQVRGGIAHAGIDVRRGRTRGAARVGGDESTSFGLGGGDVERDAGGVGGRHGRHVDRGDAAVGQLGRETGVEQAQRNDGVESADGRGRGGRRRSRRGGRAWATGRR